MKHLLLSTALCVLAQSAFSATSLPAVESPHDQVFPDIATSWDEGVPLGNATVGALVWKKGDSLRFSLDRIDLWDLRPTEFVESDIFRFKWIEEHVHKNDYSPVQRALDDPYNALPGPSKIPGAALEFDIASLGKVKSNRLYLKDALCEIVWENGVSLQTFVHSSLPIGYFCFEGVDESFVPKLIPPVYNAQNTAAGDNSHAGADLDRLGYKQGTITQGKNSTLYRQPGWGDFSYEIAVHWKRDGKKLTGVWAATSSLIKEKAADLAKENIKKQDDQLYKTHRQWWRKFWQQSSINLPDPVLEKQYYNEIYKFGSVAREHSYPISLQAVWTADNGKLPPWKGDFHHDLNTQLSYWPCYTGNYLTEGLGYLNTLWDQRETNRNYTKRFFEKNGLNVPGVCTLMGVPMGGWVQYSCSPTVSAWLAQHFHLHWKFSRDEVFLKEKGYPYLKEVATFLEEFTILENGIRKLPLSSSPEIHDNSIRAWFKDTTNYDLSLMLYTFRAAAEMADALGKKDEAEHWLTLSKQLPAFALDEGMGLAFAPKEPYRGSHRHFSHAMAIHPLGIIDWSNGKTDQHIIQATIKDLDKYGPGAWVGYSYSWLGNMKARALDGEGAAKTLRDFAECFCLRNTFHVNGDQSRSGKSGFTYRPFTLEGNFAFASGIQEMLMQSHTGTLHLFPAIPQSWKDASFQTLRANGAFLISATRKEGKTIKVSIHSEKGGTLRILNPFSSDKFNVSKGTKYTQDNNVLILETTPGQDITLVDSE